MTIIETTLLTGYFFYFIAFFPMIKGKWNIAILFTLMGFANMSAARSWEVRDLVKERCAPVAKVGE